VQGDHGSSSPEVRCLPTAVAGKCVSAMCRCVAHWLRPTSQEAKSLKDGTVHC